MAERVDRVEAEIAYLKDDMVTHAQAKKLSNENLTTCQDMLQR